jgi:hypothetical protein
MAPIFNGLQPTKMAEHPCTASSMPKNIVFQLAADSNADFGAGGAINRSFTVIAIGSNSKNAD